MKKKTLFWIVLFAVVAAGAGGWYLLRGGVSGAEARVYVDGELRETIDLSAVTIPYETTVETDYGYNVLRVSHGSIEVVRADCSEQVCVHQGAITDSLLPIVCLPHRLVIEIEEPDA